MEKIVNFISALISSFLSLMKILIRSSFFLKKYKSHNSDIYILGNGPSIKRTFESHLPFLKSKITLCVNTFPDTKYFEIIKPEYYIFSSKGYFNNAAVDYNVSVRNKTIDSLVQKTDWPLVFFLPIDAKKSKAFIKIIESNSNIKMVYFNMTPIEGLSSISHIFLSLGLGSPRPHNVLIPSILNAINSNFKSIYLLGADHSWLSQISVNDENEVLINQKHFYDETTSSPKQMHKNDGNANRTLDEVLEKFMLSFRSYRDLEKYSTLKGAKVYNLTPNSFIDAFKKKSLNEIINKS